MVGGVTSRATVTVNEFVAVLPRVSAAVHVTVVVPIGKLEPEAGEQPTGRAPSTRSVAETANDTGFGAATAETTEKLAGAVIAGAFVSTTLTTKLFGAAAFPAWSWALQVTVVGPSGNVEPGAGRHASVGDGSCE